MSGDEVRVETLDLRTKATQIRNVKFSNPLLDNPLVVPPDQLPLSKTAVENLRRTPASCIGTRTTAIVRARVWPSRSIRSPMRTTTVDDEPPRPLSTATVRRSSR